MSRSATTIKTVSHPHFLMNCYETRYIRRVYASSSFVLELNFKSGKRELFYRRRRHILNCFVLGRLFHIVLIVQFRTLQEDSEMMAVS